MSEPFEFVESGGWKVPLYLLQFDKDGAAASVEARKGLLDAVTNGGRRDVYVFAHGWNNDFDDSLVLFRTKVVAGRHNHRYRHSLMVEI
jgi:hypothetical protein